VTCKGICKDLQADKMNRSLEDRPNVRKCTTCEIDIASEFWVKSKSGRIRCPCCKIQLRIHSRGKGAREKRQKRFAEATI